MTEDICCCYCCHIFLFVDQVIVQHACGKGQLKKKYILETNFENFLSIS